MSRSRPRSAPLRAAIRSPRSLRRLPGRASAEPAAVHVAPEIYIRLAGSPEPGGSRAEPRREGAGGGRAARARGAGAGRRKGRAERPRRPPRSGARPPGPSPGRRPLPLHPGEGVPETAPSLTPPPRFPGSSLRRRSSTMPDSFDTLQRQRPEGGGRAGERKTGRCELGGGECSGRSPSPLTPRSPETPACPRPR